MLLRCLCHDCFCDIVHLSQGVLWSGRGGGEMFFSLTLFKTKSGILSGVIRETFLSWDAKDLSVEMKSLQLMSRPVNWWKRLRENKEEEELLP